MKLSITYVASVLALFYAASNAAPVSQIGDVNSLAAREPGAAGSRSKPPKDSFARRELGTEQGINDLAARADSVPRPITRSDTNDSTRSTSSRRRFRREIAAEEEVNDLAARSPDMYLKPPPRTDTNDHPYRRRFRRELGQEQEINDLAARSPDMYLKPPPRTDTNDHPYRHRCRREIATEGEVIDLVSRTDDPRRNTRPSPRPTPPPSGGGKHYRRELDAEDGITDLVARGFYDSIPPQDHSSRPFSLPTHHHHRRELDTEAELN